MSLKKFDFVSILKEQKKHTITLLPQTKIFRGTRYHFLAITTAIFKCLFSDIQNLPKPRILIKIYLKCIMFIPAVVVVVVLLVVLLNKVVAVLSVVVSSVVLVTRVVVVVVVVGRSEVVVIKLP